MSRIAKDVAVSTFEEDTTGFNGSLFRAVNRAIEVANEDGEAKFMDIHMPDGLDDAGKAKTIMYRVIDLLVLNHSTTGSMESKDSYMAVGTGELVEASTRSFRDTKEVLESTVMDMFGVQQKLINLREREITGTFVNEQGKKRNIYGPASFKAYILMDQPDRAIAQSIANSNYEQIVARREEKATDALAIAEQEA